MKTTAKSRISGIAVEELLMKYGVSGEMTLKSRHLLVDDDGNKHGEAGFVGPWPERVSKLIAALKEAAEAHLLSIHFEVSDGAVAGDGAVAAGEDGAPTGIFGSEVGDTAPEASQL